MNINFVRLIKLIVTVLFIFYSQVSEAKFINTFLVRIGGPSLGESDAPPMAKHDIIICNRFHYDDINGDSWSAIRTINPDVEIYLYTMVTIVSTISSDYSTVYLNDIGRYEASRGHSMGDLNNDNPNLFLLDGSGNRIEWAYDRMDKRYWLDFGNPNFQDYTIEAAITDFTNQAWTADGVFSDHAWCLMLGTKDGAVPASYPTDAQWATAMNSLMTAITEDLNAVGQKFAGNRGPTWDLRGAAAYDAWIAQDSSSYPMDVALEEGGIAVKHGAGDVQFFHESRWKRQIDLYKNMQNTKVCILASVGLTSTTSSGTDNWGKSFSFWDAFYYALGSYLIGKNDVNKNSYFAFHYGSGPYNKVNLYYEEYDEIDLGSAIDTYQVTVYDGNNIYWREFENGYVYVNPTLNDVTSISLPEGCKQRTHANLYTPLGELSEVSSIDLDSHRAAILYKVKINTGKAPNAPKNLRALLP